MSGEKNDLFTSLSSFLKMSQLSSVCSHAGSLQLWWGDALWPLSTQTEGKMSENPFFWSSFNSCRPCSRRRCKSPAAVTCDSCLHWLLEPGLDWSSLASWLRDVAPSHKPCPCASPPRWLLQFCSSDILLEPLLSGRCQSKDGQVVSCKEEEKAREHLSVFATWVGGRKQFSQ